MHQGAHLEFGRALGPVGRGPVVAAARVEEDLPAGHGRVLVDGVGQAEARVLPRHLLLAEVAVIQLCAHLKSFKGHITCHVIPSC